MANTPNTGPEKKLTERQAADYARTLKENFPGIAVETKVTNDDTHKELAYFDKHIQGFRERGLIEPDISSEQLELEEKPKEKFSSPEEVAEAKTKALGILEQVKGSIKIIGEHPDKKQKILDNVFATLKERVQLEASLPTFEELKTLAIGEANRQIGSLVELNNALPGREKINIPTLIEGLLKKPEIQKNYEEAKKVIESVCVDRTNKKSTALDNMSEVELNNVDTLIDSIPKDAWDDIPEGETKSLGDLYKEAVMSGYKGNYDKWEAKNYPPDVFKKFGRMIGGLFDKLSKILGPIFAKLSGLPVIGDALGFLKGFFPEKKEEEIPDSKKAFKNEVKEARNKIEWTNANDEVKAAFKAFKDGGEIAVSPDKKVTFPAMKELLSFVSGTDDDYKNINVADFEGWYKNTPDQIHTLLDWAKTNKGHESFSKISRETWEALLKCSAKIEVSADKTVRFAHPTNPDAPSRILETWSDKALRKVLGMEAVAEKSADEIKSLYDHLAEGVNLESIGGLWEGEGKERKPKKFLKELASDKMKSFWGSYRITSEDLQSLAEHAGKHGDEGMKPLEDAGIRKLENATLEYGGYWLIKEDKSLDFEQSSWKRFWTGPVRFEVGCSGVNVSFTSVEAFFRWVKSRQSKFQEDDKAWAYGGENSATETSKETEVEKPDDKKDE